MPYTQFNQALPNATTQNGTSFAQSIRENLVAVRDACILGGGFVGFNLYALGGSGTAAIDIGGTMTVSAISSGTFAVGQVITGSGITGTQTIIALGTGTGGTGTYITSFTTVVASTLITGTNTVDAPQSLLYSKSTERVRAQITWGTSGGASGNPEIIHYSYSSDGGLNYTSMGTKTITYDALANVSSTAWS